jgi:hypothetical protein
MATVESFIVQNLGSALAKYTGNPAISWIVSGILGQSGDTEPDLKTIQTELTNLSTEVAAVEASVASFQSLYEATEAYDNLIAVLTSGPVPLSTIQHDFTDMTGLNIDDVKSAQGYATANVALGYASALQASTDVMCGTSSSAPGDLMGAAADIVIVKLTSAKTRDGATLLAAYQTLEDHCHGIFSMQVKALTLAANCYTAVNEIDEAQKALTNFTSTLPAQCTMFLNAIENLATAYYPDDSLIDMFIGDETQDIIRLAHTFINNYVTDLTVAATTSRIWVWSGSGPSFSVVSPTATAPSLPFENLVPTAIVKRTFANGGNTWNLGRFEYYGIAQNAYGMALTSTSNVAVIYGDFNNKLLALGWPWSFRLGAPSTGGNSAVLLSETSFKATAGSANLPASGSTGTAQFWAYVTSPGALAGSGTKTKVDGARDRLFDVIEWTLSVDASGTVVTLMGISNTDASVSRTITVTSSRSVFEQWIPFTVTVSGSTLGLSFDGGTAHTIDLPFQLSFDGGITVGRDPQGASGIGSCQGLFNSVCFWDTVLTQQQIQESLSATTPSGATALWRLDRGNYADAMGGASGTGSGDATFVTPVFPVQVGGLILGKSI